MDPETVYLCIGCSIARKEKRDVAFCEQLRRNKERSQDENVDKSQ